MMCLRPDVPERLGSNSLDVINAEEVMSRRPLMKSILSGVLAATRVKWCALGGASAADRIH